MKSSGSTSTRAFPRGKARGHGPEIAGFTLMETMIAIACFMALIWGFWAFALRASQAMLSSSAAAGSAARAAMIDRGIRAMTLRISPPFWSKPIEASQGASSAEQSLSVPYLDGKPESSLKLSYSGGRLILDADGKILSFKADSVGAMRLVGAPGGESSGGGEGSGGSALGIEISYTLGKETFSTRAAFSSSSLVASGGGK
jgi:hypothetical protein